MNKVLRFATIAAAAGMMSVWLTPVARADAGSQAFDRYVQDVQSRVRAINEGSYWVSSMVDRGAFERYIAALGQSAAGPGMTDTAEFVAGMNPQPLRTFNTYLAYLGQRMRADAGPPGPLLATENGTASFDRYIEELNYRIQTLNRAEDSTGF